MRMKTNWLVAALLAATWSVTASAVEDGDPLKVGMISDSGRFDDAGYNQSCREGLEQAMHEFKIYGYFRQSEGAADFKKKLKDLVNKDYDLIVALGFQMRKELAAVAEENPDVKFAIVDGYYENPPPNIRSLVFKVDEVGFPAGYLAAAWADLQDPDDPRVAYVGGMKIESVERFTVPFEKGVEYYNKKNDRKVKTHGDYTGTFRGEAKGKKMALDMIEKGVDVLFGVGGLSGNGALYAAKEKGKWGIGVDVDQYMSLPDVQDILLTSAVKSLDRSVYETVSAVIRGEFTTKGEYVGTLMNGGVKLAPFHDFEDTIPAKLKKELKTIQRGIIRGDIETGWPIKPKR